MARRPSSAEPIADDEPPAEAPAAAAAESLPGEDRGLEHSEVTRPIPVGVLGPPVEPPSEPEPAAAETEDGAVPVEEEDDSGREAVPLPTMTLARLALEQGDRALSVATLEGLIERDPDHAEAIAMLDELRAQDADRARQRERAESALVKAAALQGWLDAVRLAAERRLR